MSGGIQVTNSAASLKTRVDKVLEAQGFLAWSSDPAGAFSGAAFTSGDMMCAGIYLYAGDVVTRVHFNIAVAGTTVTVCRAALYSSAGVLLGSCANTTSLATDAANRRDVTLTAPVTITTDGVYYAGCLAVFSGTAPQLGRMNNVGTSPVVTGPGTTMRYVRQQSLADLPDPATFVSGFGGVVFMVS